MDTPQTFPTAASPERQPAAAAPLSVLEARVLGCLIEKEFATPDLYPLTLNSLVNACNQRSNRAPVLEVGAREVEAAIEGLRLRRMAALFAGADARVPKFKQTLDLVYPLPPEQRALLAELLLRGPQTTAGLRGNTERLVALPEVAELETWLVELAAAPVDPLVRKLPRQTGQKEARWAQLLTGEPAVDEAGGALSGSGFGAGSGSGGTAAGTAAQPLTVRLTLPPEAEERIARLEAHVVRLDAELARLRAALGE